MQQISVHALFRARATHKLPLITKRPRLIVNNKQIQDLLGQKYGYLRQFDKNIYKHINMIWRTLQIHLQFAQEYLAIYKDKIIDEKEKLQVTQQITEAKRNLLEFRKFLIKNKKIIWAGLDSNQRTLMRAILQTASFSHSETYPIQTQL